MIRAKVIQNYYERFGNFDKIHNSYTGKLVEDGEDLYEKLGYMAIKYQGKKYSAKDVHDLRIAFLRNDMRTITSITGCETLEEITKILKSNKMLPVRFEQEDVGVSNALKPCLEILSEYYRNLNSYVLFKNNYLPLKDALASMKFHPKAIKSNIKQLMADNKSVLVSVESGETLAAYGRKLYTTKGLSERQISTLQQKALLHAALRGTLIPEKYVRNPLDLFMIGLSDRDTYLGLLETAELEGKTYVQLLEGAGFHVPNCETMYKELGTILAIVGQHAVILTQNEQGEDTVNFTTDLMAKQMCSKLIRN